MNIGGRDETGTSPSIPRPDEGQSKTDLLVGLTRTRDQIRKPLSYMLTLLLWKQAKVGRPDTSGSESQCLAQGGLSGRKPGRDLTVKTVQGNLTVTETTGGVSVGYAEKRTKRAGRPRGRHFGAVRNRKMIRRYRAGKLINGQWFCLCGRVPMFLDHRCEDCFAEDQSHYTGKSQNLRLFHTVK